MAQIFALRKPRLGRLRFIGTAGADRIQVKHLYGEGADFAVALPATIRVSPQVYLDGRREIGLDISGLVIVHSRQMERDCMPVNCLGKPCQIHLHEFGNVDANHWYI